MTSRPIVAIAALCLLVAVGVGWRTGIAQNTKPAGGVIGVVDVVALLEQALQTPEYSEPRDALYQEIDAALMEAQSELMTLNQQIQGMPQDDPARAGLIAQFQMVQSTLQQRSQQESERYDRLSVRQAQEIYEKVYTAAKTIAARRGYAYVLSSRMPEGELVGQFDLTGAAQQILARPVLVGAEGNDLTAEVRAELGLPEPGAEADPAAQDAGAAEEPAGADDSQD